MSFQRFWVVGLLVACLALPAVKLGLVRGTDRLPDLRSLSEVDLKSLAIKLERTRCYGTCPAYVVTIHGDGRVEYDGKAHVKETGTREGNVDIAAVRALASEFGKARFVGIASEFSETKCKGRVCTDMPTAITEVRIKGTTHRVTHYYGCERAPKSLFKLESA